MNLLYPRRCPVCQEILEDQNSLICAGCRKTIVPIHEPRCFLCGRPVKEAEEYCPDCRKEPHVFDQGRGIFLYDDRMKRSIMSCKYGGCREYSRFYARAMYIYGGRKIKEWKPQVIVPVPLYAGDRRRRGFNQAECIAEELSAYTGIRQEELVRKVRRTKHQKELSAGQRRQNLKEAFVVTEPVKGLRVLVVDDVYTTGATMDAMALCLKEKGAQKVFFLAVCTAVQ